MLLNHNRRSARRSTQVLATLRGFVAALSLLSTTAPASEDGTYQWALVTTVAEQQQTENPNYCSEVVCWDIFFNVSLKVQDVLGARSEPAPRVVLETDHWGVDPFESGRRFRYLMFVHNFGGIPRVGVSLPVLETNDGKLAVPVFFLLPWMEESGCEANIRELNFARPRQWLNQRIGPVEEEARYPEITTWLRYGTRQGELMHHTHGIYVGDLAAGARTLRIGCGPDGG